MPNIRDIKRRIQAIGNIQHVTRAMEMVAASKLRRVQGQLWAARPYAYKVAEVVGRLAQAPQVRELPLVAPREVKRVGYVLFTGDRGLAGAYNANLINLAADRLNREEHSVALVAVGGKGARYFLKRSVELLKYYESLTDEPDLLQARELARQLMGFYLDRKVDEINLIYPRFHSALRYENQVERFLPLVAPVLRSTEAIDYIYEPEPRSMLEIILPRYCEMKVYQALLEAKASEHGARMVAMESATSNADEVIDQLTLSFNKARQGAITREIVEIATSAEALRARS